jgi:hypothetical protein
MPLLALWFYEFAVVLVRLDYVARFIENANHSIMGAAAVLCVADCIADRVWLGVPQRTELQLIADQIDASRARVGISSNHATTMQLLHPPYRWK